MWHLQGQAIDPDALGAQERRPWGPGFGCDLACQFLDSILIAQRFLVKLSFFYVCCRFFGFTISGHQAARLVLQGQTSGVRGVATPTPSGVRMVLVSMSFVDIFLWPTVFFCRFLLLWRQVREFWTSHRCLVGPKCSGNARRIGEKPCAWG